MNAGPGGATSAAAAARGSHADRLIARVVSAISGQFVSTEHCQTRWLRVESSLVTYCVCIVNGCLSKTVELSVTHDKLQFLAPGHSLVISACKMSACVVAQRMKEMYHALLPLTLALLS